MSIRMRSLVPFLAAWAVLATLILSTPAGQANPGTMPAPAATTKGKSGKQNGEFRDATSDSSNGSVTIAGRKESSQPGKSVESGKSSSGSSDSTSGHYYCSSSPAAAATPGTPHQGRALDSFGRSLDEEYEVCEIRPSSSPVPGGADPKVVAQQAVATLTLPDVSPVIQPDPEWNQWKTYILGVGLWMWTDSPDRAETTVT